MKIYLFALALSFLSAPVIAAPKDDIKKLIPELTSPVMDQAGLLTPPQAAEIQTLLEKMNATEKIQMAIFITPSLGENDIESYSMAIAERWKLGAKKKDQGLLWVIAPQERKMRMEVGYGLEGDITDAFTKKVDEDYVKPYFQQKQFAVGLAAGILAIAAKLQIEGMDNVPLPRPSRQRSGRGLNPLLVLFFFILFPFLFSSFFRGRGGGGGYWGGGGYGGFGGGGFGGGGSGGGGGFGGGGGGFGGGGSSSDW